LSYLTRHFNIPIFIPELGCPFRCVFCNQRSITGKKEYPLPDEITNIIETYLSTIKKNSFIEIGFFGGNFTGIPEGLMERYLAIANKYVKYSKINGIRVSTRPDYINDNKLYLLKKYGVTTIELGVQSLNDNVLKVSKRGYEKKDVIIASKKIKDMGFRLGHQVMIGLPYSDINTEIETAKEIIKIGVDDLRIYPLLVLEGTELEEMYNNKVYKPLSLEEAILRTKEFVKIVYKKTNIIRIGLHPSEDLQIKKFIGPFHPSFRELVMSKLCLDVVYKINESFKSDEIQIIINPKEYNFFIGYRKENKNFLYKNFKRVKILKEEKIKRGFIVVKNADKTRKFSIV